VNGDGIPDVLAGAAFDCNRGRDSGMARVFSGRDGTALLSLDGSAEHDALGSALAGVGDLDGDGRCDFIVLAPGADPDGALDAGSAYVISGKRCGTDRGR
jgi:hypothetical protein